MEINITPRKLTLTLLSIVAILTVIHSIVLFLYFYLDDPYVFGLVDLFDFDIEANFPTYYSAAALLLAAGLLVLTTRANWRQPDGYRYHWLLLTVLFLFLSFDEAMAIHESIGVWFEDFVEPTGFLYFMWVLPYGVAVLVLGLAMLKFLLSLPAATRNGFFLAAALFLGGAIGIEVFGAREADLNGTETITYCVLYTFEEIFEMTGVIVFVHTLASHLIDNFGPVSLVFNHETVADNE